MEPVRIRFGGYQPPTSVHTKAAEVLGNVLTRRLGQAIHFDLNSNIVASGHNAADLLPMVEHGTLTLCYFSMSYLVDRIPQVGLLDTPFLFTDRARAYAVLDGPFGQFLAERIRAKTGFQLLAFWDNGFRHISNAVRPIRTPADCAGLRLRTQPSPLHGKLFTLLGFTPVALDVKELLAGVQSGSIDAQENPLTTMFHFGIHTCHRYITLSSHLFGAAVVLCHRHSYESWPAEVRQALHAAVAEATAVQRRLASAADDEVLTRLHPSQNEIVSLTATEHALFVAAVAPLVNEQRQIFGEEIFRYMTC
jgi:TRAP-type transport system periplasmic protein